MSMVYSLSDGDSLFAVPGPPGPGDVLHLREEHAEGLCQLLLLGRDDLKGKRSWVTLWPNHMLPRSRQPLLGYTVSPSNPYAEVLAPVPQNGALFENKAVADMIGYDEVIQE